MLSINPHLGAKASNDVLTSFTPVVKIGDAPNVMTVHPSVPANSVKAFIALAKARPGALAYASNGAGTLSHLTGELFSQRAGVKMLHVPYKGAAPATIDTVAGNVSVLFAAYPSVSAQVRAGRLKALAVTSAKRIAIAPELPTVAEAALKDFESSQWWGLYGPAGLPAAAVERLNAAGNKVLATDDIKKALALDGAVPAGGTPAALAAAGILSAVTRGLNASIGEGLLMESEQFARLVPSHDLGEGLEAWKARRVPVYAGR